jgi:hypothetical protein
MNRTPFWIIVLDGLEHVEFEALVPVVDALEDERRVHEGGGLVPVRDPGRRDDGEIDGHALQHVLDGVLLGPDVAGMMQIPLELDGALVVLGGEVGELLNRPEVHVFLGKHRVADQLDGLSGLCLPDPTGKQG